MVSGFLIGSEQSRKRTLRRTGALVVAIALLIVLVIVYVVPAFTPRDKNLMAVTINVQSVGPGVENGTDVVMRGAPVGKVTALHIKADGTSSVSVDLQKNRVRGLGRDFGIDFRAKNYFGITGINITDPGSEQSGTLRDGDRVTRREASDYTMATMIEQGSDVANGTLVPETTNAIKRVLAYTGAFTPLIHTGVVFADVVARTQRETPAYLIDRYNDIVSALPPFADGAISALSSFYDSALRPAGDEVQNNFTSTLKAISDNFFSMVGTLLRSNQANLTPIVDVATQSATVLPAIGQSAITPVDVRELVTRLDGAFTDGRNGEKILKVNLALQRLPALSGALPGLSNGQVR